MPPNWCFSFSWRYRFCGKLSVFINSRPCRNRARFEKTHRARRKCKIIFLKSKERWDCWTLVAAGKVPGISGIRTNAKQIYSSDTSLWAEWQHCEAQGLLQRQYDMFVFTPRCACRGAYSSHWPTSCQTKEFLCAEQKDRGNSDPKTAEGTYEVRPHTQSCRFVTFQQQYMGVILFCWCIQVKTIVAAQLLLLSAWAWMHKCISDIRYCSGTAL